MGWPSWPSDYQGGRDFKSLKKFAEENLKPMCSPKNIDLCDADKKAAIEKFQNMPDAELDSLISSEEKKIEDAETTFKTELDKLQEAYKKLMEDKENTIAEVKAASLGLMKAVKASKTSGNDEL